jgi:hypothetical protein
MSKPRILVLGHGGHGKDTLCVALQTTFKLTYLSSSLAALPYIFPVLSLVTRATLPEEAYKRRKDNRELWRELIALYNCQDKSALARRVVAHADIYNGMRCRKEFEASRHLFDLIFFVDAFDRVGFDKTMDIAFDENTMTLIDNNHTFNELYRQVEGLSHLFE